MGKTSKFGKRSTADETAGDINLQGKNVIITGANTGIGYQTARVLGKHGAEVTICCRDMKKGQDAIDKLLVDAPGANFRLEKLDLSSMASVREFADRYKATHTHLHILVCNAGVMAPPLSRTTEGYELQYGTNHLGHFLLFNLLVEELARAAPSRVVVVSSDAHKFGGMNWDDINWEKNYKKWDAYAQSKICNILFTVELTRRYQSRGITAFSLHPGVIASDLWRHGSFFESLINLGVKIGLVKDVNQGAATSVYCAVAPELEGKGGLYFEDSNVQTAKPYATNPESAERIWILSLSQVDGFLNTAPPGTETATTVASSSISPVDESTTSA